MAALLMGDDDGDGAMDDGAAEELMGAGEDEAGVLVVLEPPQAVSPISAAAVRPTKARAGRFVDNMSFSLFCGTWALVPSVVGHGRPGFACASLASASPACLCLTSYSAVGMGWMGAD
ncbi:hypothetical protein GCM10010523_33700 [Paenarthrobacter ilicis]